MLLGGNMAKIIMTIMIYIDVLDTINDEVNTFSMFVRTKGYKHNGEYQPVDFKRYILIFRNLQVTNVVWLIFASFIVLCGCSQSLLF